MLTAPAGGYVIDPINGGGTIPDPGPRGWSARRRTATRIVLLTVQGDRLATSDGTTLDLPDYSGIRATKATVEGDEIYPQLDEILRRLDDDDLSTASELGGNAYAGRGDFVAYLLGIDGLMPTQPVYIIYGTPTTDAQLGMFSDSNVVIREYALTEDPIGQIAACRSSGTTSTAS